MLLVIHNLPSTTRYLDVKSLIREKCGLTEVIVDNLVPEGKSKKVTIGLADARDAAILMKKINGLFVNNNQLYVEDICHKKSYKKPYQPDPNHQYVQEQYSQCVQPVFNDQVYGECSSHQFQLDDTPLEHCTPGSNFGVPFYMTAQNHNVDDNLQYMVQYPKLQGHLGNESYEGRDIGFDQQYDGRRGDRSRSPNRSTNTKRSPRAFSKWNKTDNKLYGRRDREHNDRHVVDRSYRDKPNRYPFQGSNQYSNASNKGNYRYEMSPTPPEPKWERAESSVFGETKEYFQGRGYKPEREPQRFKEEKFSQSRGSDCIPQPGEFSRKRPYESSDNLFLPKKKMGKKQQVNSRNGSGTSSNSFFNKFSNKKNTNYDRTPPVRPSVQQNRSYVLKGPHMQPKGQQEQNNRAQRNALKRVQLTRNPSATISENEKLAKNMVWRGQATADITNQILNKMGILYNKRNPVIVKLKQCVRARIDVVIGNDLSQSIRDMVSEYYKKFQDDAAFYNAVVDNVNKSKAEDNEPMNKETECRKIEDDEVKSETAPPPQPAKNPSNNVVLKPLINPGKRLPKYPEGNKKVLNQMKQAQREEMLNESLYTLDAAHEKALIDELDKIDELIRKEFENPDDETETSLSKFLNDVFVSDVRKVLTLHVKKRLLNIQTGLVIRVNCHPKKPNRDMLDSFLKDRGVISLSPSERNKNVFIAVCANYDSFDNLCTEANTVIDNSRITFRALHLTGPPVVSKYKNQASNITCTKETESKDDIFPSIIQNKDENEDVCNKKGHNDVHIAENVTLDKTDSDNEPKANKDQVSTHENDDNILTIKGNKADDIIAKDENNDKSLIDDKGFILLDGAPRENADFEAIAADDKGDTIESRPEIDVNKDITINGDNVTITNDDENAVKLDIVDNYNIAEDDLEDF